jgi:hypothetical protein
VRPAALVEVLAATEELCREAAVPPEPFRGDLLTAAVSCGEEVAGLARRIVVAGHDHAGDAEECGFCAPVAHKHPPADPKPPARPLQPPTPPPAPRDVAAAARGLSPNALLRVLDAASVVAHSQYDTIRGDSDVRLAAAALAEQLTATLADDWQLADRSCESVSEVTLAHRGWLTPPTPDA